VALFHANFLTFVTFRTWPVPQISMVCEVNEQSESLRIREIFS
jgi:hypothetical protein